MLFKDVIATHPSINLESMRDNYAFYAGGEEFNSRKKRFVIRRATEEDSSAWASKHYAERLKRAQYINRCSAVVDWVVAISTRGIPRIETEQENEYYESLNKDSDGQGKPFSSLVRELMSDMLVTKYPYVEAIFEGEDVDPDYRIRRIDPLTVIDFEIENGVVDWVKTHTLKNVRTSTYGKADQILNIITFYKPNSTEVYTFYGENGSYKDEDGNTIGLDDEVNPNLESVYDHEFGSVPVSRGNSTDFHHILNRLQPVLITLFNAEIDLNFTLSQAAFPQPYIVLSGANRADKIVRSESSMFVFEIGESGGYISPPTKAFDALFTNIERLKNGITESMQSLSADAAAIPQAGRLSGDAVREMRSPLESMVTALTWPVKDMLTDILNKIAYARGENIEIEIEGFGDVEITEEDINALTNMFPSKPVINNSEVEDEEDTLEEEERD